MLRGFSVPLSPQGKSTLATLPPWHYSSDCTAIEYWADPGAVAALLPRGLTPDEKSGGRAFFWFLNWQFTGSNDELTDPARYQYREAFVLVEAIFEDNGAIDGDQRGSRREATRSAIGGSSRRKSSASVSTTMITSKKADSKSRSIPKFSHGSRQA
jgi:hypothetical protein